MRKQKNINAENQNTNVENQNINVKNQNLITDLVGGGAWLVDQYGRAWI